MKIEKALALAVHEQTAGKSEKTHHQREVETVERRELVIRHIAAKCGGCRHVKQRADRDGRKDADHDERKHENLRRDLHVTGRLVWRVDRKINRLAVEENVVDKTCGVSHREDARQGRHDWWQPGPEPRQVQRQ